MKTTKRKKNKFKTVDWRTLKKGDVIRIIGQNGPYTMVDHKKCYINVPSGNYKVNRLDNDGIHAYQGISHFFIYMGLVKKTLVGTAAPHKIKKVLTNT